MAGPKELQKPIARPRRSATAERIGQKGVAAEVTGTHRLHVVLNKIQYEWVRRSSFGRRVSIGETIRTMIDNEMAREAIKSKSDQGELPV